MTVSVTSPLQTAGGRPRPGHGVRKTSERGVDRHDRADGCSVHKLAVDAPSDIVLCHYLNCMGRDLGFHGVVEALDPVPGIGVQNELPHRLGGEHADKERSSVTSDTISSSIAASCAASSDPGNPRSSGVLSGIATPTWIARLGREPGVLYRVSNRATIGRPWWVPSNTCQPLSSRLLGLRAFFRPNMPGSSHTPGESSLSAVSQATVRE